MNQKSLENEPLRRYYSQHGEDCLLWKFFDFKSTGYFVEVGAFDGIHLSNTYSFEKEGWKGICVEPGQYFSQCKKNRPNSVCIDAACVASEEIKEITFYKEDLGLFSTMNMFDEKLKYFSSVYQSRGLNFNDVQEEKVKAVTLNNILKNNNGNELDFISIDVEGAEIDVLNGFDISKYKPRVILIEANDEEHKEKLRSYLSKFNYILAKQVSVNLFFVSNEQDFDKINKIVINCTIEKQIHPLGEKYTDKEYLYGLMIYNGIDILKQLTSLEKEILSQQKILTKKDKDIGKMKIELVDKEVELQNQNKELNKVNKKLTPIINSRSWKLIRFIKKILRKEV